MRHILAAIVGIGLLAFLPGSYARAQDNNESMSSVYIDNEKDIVPVEDGYIPTRFQDLSKLYWATGKFDIADSRAVDDFLLINECELYDRFYTNEFEWSKIREATRDFITQNLVTFPTKFELMVPVYLGRYNIEKEEFEVDPQSMMTSTRRIDVTVNRILKRCNMTVAKEIENYPSNVVVYLNRPVAFVKLPVQRELANLYIEYFDRTYDEMPQELKRPDRARVAWLRLKVKMVQYKETMLVEGRDLRAVIVAQLDGIEVYADPEKKQLLYSQDVRSKKIRRRKGDKIDVIAPEEVPPHLAPPPAAGTQQEPQDEKQPAQ